MVCVDYEYSFNFFSFILYVSFYFACCIIDPITFCDEIDKQDQLSWLFAILHEKSCKNNDHNTFPRACGESN